jgi:hypothetical protein
MRESWRSMFVFKNRLKLFAEGFVFALAVFGLVCVTADANATSTLAPPYLEGHNLTSTTYVLAPHQWTVGTYALGYGVTEKLTIATTPWLDLIYNMPTLEAKYAVAIDDRWRWSEEILYFQTQPYLRNHYKMTAVMDRIGASYKFNDVVTLHSQFVSFYYFDETVPFSLRLTPDNDQKYELAVGLLLETHLSEHWGTFMELGAIGLNYANVYTHLGSSLFYQFSSGYVQVGISDSFTARWVNYSQNGTTTSSYGEIQSVYHPEVAIQYFF